MRRDGEKLIFREDESSDLLSVFACYLESTEVQNLDPAVVERLEANRQLAGDLTQKRLFREVRPDLSDADINELNYKIVAELSPERLPFIIKDATEVKLDNGDGDITTVIKWAAENLRPGSTALQNVVGERLNSSYEDHPVSAALGSTNESMANHAAKAALAAGQAATKWLSQLEIND